MDNHGFMAADDSRYRVYLAIIAVVCFCVGDWRCSYQDPV
jgi:hypothetical protein